MAGPFKMKGMSFGNSPMKQDKKAKVIPQKEGFRLMAGQQVKGEPREYFKVYSGGRKVKISESEYNALKNS
jgi:hypothetical protein